MERRKFLKAGGILAAAGFFSTEFRVTAGPFNLAEFPATSFPADKKLDATWVKQLFERGEPTTYRKTENEVKYIGMPVGGICAGGVYVGGDGRLWLWDIFNKNQLGASTKVLPVELKSFNLKEINNVEGTLYLEPLTEVTPLQQGLALSITQNGRTTLKRLHEDDWPEVIFEATYPVANIRYIDSDFPLEVTLNAFSPFIPGDPDDSGLPATVQSLILRNRSGEALEVEVLGWLENKLLLNTEKYNGNFTRENSEVKGAEFQGIELTCNPHDEKLKKAADFGNMFFAVLGNDAVCIPDVMTTKDEKGYKLKDFINPSETNPVGGIIKTLKLQPGSDVTTDFMYAWYTPNVCFYCSPEGKPVNQQGMTVQDAESHYYTNRFDSGRAVAAFLATNYSSLKNRTFLWKDTWYDSTLPWWYLERSLLNISTLATTTTHRFQSGRYYAWEGVGCCHGNCTHVYQYAQAVSRIFPQLERDTRERVDLGIGFDDTTGMIRIRGEKTGPSIDGQAGTVLRILREHQMSPDYSFLTRNWKKIKKAVSFIMNQDKNKDGMEDTPMENTLDALWHGEISWIVGLCLAGVKAGQQMAEEMHDNAFAKQCEDYVAKGSANMEKYLFNGEYFIHRPDPAVGKKEIGSFNTCHIDQVYGQSWAWQVNLGRILSKEKTMSALRALWKYNYMPDVGPYIKKHTGGRFYALAGEGGMVMNTNPTHEVNPYGNAKAWQVGYFSECMSGFEYQVASHMMAEGMTEESMILTRSIHDRYHAYKRNPFNEIECSDHYGRAMASYGGFISACGFSYHGPKGHIGFEPRLTPEQFKAPFTAAIGWGTYSQQRNETSFSGKIKLVHGKLEIEKLFSVLDPNHEATTVSVTINGNGVSSDLKRTVDRCVVTLKNREILKEGDVINYTIK